MPRCLNSGLNSGFCHAFPEDTVIVMDTVSFHSKEHLNLIAEKYHRKNHFFFLPTRYPN